MKADAGSSKRYGRRPPTTRCLRPKPTLTSGRTASLAGACGVLIAPPPRVRLPLLLRWLPGRPVLQLVTLLRAPLGRGALADLRRLRSGAAAAEHQLLGGRVAVQVDLRR